MRREMRPSGTGRESAQDEGDERMDPATYRCTAACISLAFINRAVLFDCNPRDHQPDTLVIEA